jgi:hypothetical protein
MVGKVKAYAYPDNTESAGLLERCRENWDLLQKPSQFCATLALFPKQKT